VDELESKKESMQKMGEKIKKRKSGEYSCEGGYANTRIIKRTHKVMKIDGAEVE
jgi:hypothetical protein